MTDMLPQCRDCPGPLVFQEKFFNIITKVDLFDVWRWEFDFDNKQYRKEREMEEKMYREKVENKFSNLKSWAVATLTAVVLVLLAQIILMVRQ